MRISDWSSDVCSSDLPHEQRAAADQRAVADRQDQRQRKAGDRRNRLRNEKGEGLPIGEPRHTAQPEPRGPAQYLEIPEGPHLVLEEGRSEEHTSELQSLMRISYAVFCLKQKTRPNITYIINS